MQWEPRRFFFPQRTSPVWSLQHWGPRFRLGSNHAVASDGHGFRSPGPRDVLQVAKGWRCEPRFPLGSALSRGSPTRAALSGLSGGLGPWSLDILERAWRRVHLRLASLCWFKGANESLVYYWYITGKLRVYTSDMSVCRKSRSFHHPSRWASWIFMSNNLCIDRAVPQRSRESWLLLRPWTSMAKDLRCFRMS